MARKISPRLNLERTVIRHLLKSQPECVYCGATLEEDNVTVSETQPTSTPGLEEALRNYRTTCAREEKVPPYQIYTDKTLNSIISILPRTREDLLRVHGIGEAKADKHGVDIIEITSQFPDSASNPQQLNELQLSCFDCEVLEKRNVRIPKGVLDRIQSAPHSFSEAVRIGLGMYLGSLSAEVDSDAIPSTRQSLLFEESVHLASDLDGRRLSTSFDLVDLGDE